jgi:cbb3-type cytochrome c oxidase subunit III
MDAHMVTKSHIRIIFGLSFALVLFIASALAQGQTEAVDGAAVFKKRCSMCHGPEGKGFSANKTPDFTSSEWQKSITDEEITETVKNGKKGTPMPAFGSKLSEDEVKAVVGHVRSLGAEKK